MGKKVFVVGGTGFVGRHLLDELVREGYEVYALVRNRRKVACINHSVKPIFGDPCSPGPWQDKASECEFGINLAGANIFKRWTDEYKRLIRDSRVLSTRFLAEALSSGKGRVLVNASAVGYYGDTGDDLVDEGRGPSDDFLGRTCVEWEEAAFGFSEALRVCTARFGIVLGADGGALLRMLPAFKLGLGGPIGNGRQWFPWVHIRDVVRALVFLLEKKEASGPFNVVSPGIVRQKEFAKTLGRVLRRPAVIPTPVSALRLVFGEVAEVLVASCRAYPKRLLELGFKFEFPELEDALRDLLQ